MRRLVKVLFIAVMTIIMVGCGSNHTGVDEITESEYMQAAMKRDYEYFSEDCVDYTIGIVEARISGTMLDLNAKVTVSQSAFVTSTLSIDGKIISDKIKEFFITGNILYYNEYIIEEEEDGVNEDGESYLIQSIGSKYYKIDLPEDFNVELV